MYSKFRDKANSMLIVCSATVFEFAKGVNVTWMPSLVAAARSMLLTPTPCRATTFNFLPASSTSAGNSAVRARMASQSTTAALMASTEIPSLDTIS